MRSAPSRTCAQPGAALSTIRAGQPLTIARAMASTAASSRFESATPALSSRQTTPTSHAPPGPAFFACLIVTPPRIGLNVPTRSGRGPRARGVPDGVRAPVTPTCGLSVVDARCSMISGLVWETTSSHVKTGCAVATDE